MAGGEGMVEQLLDAWDRSNRILVNLLRAVPPGGLEARAMAGSPAVGEMFAHMHYVRLVFLEEDVPEKAVAVPGAEWQSDGDAEKLATDLNSSAQAVREAVEACMRSGQEMQMHYDHPMLFLQHMIWHEGYHHGQIKLALKIAGHPLDDEAVGPLTWDVWMEKTISWQGRESGHALRERAGDPAAG